MSQWLTVNFCDCNHSIISGENLHFGEPYFIVTSIIFDIRYHYLVVKCLIILKFQTSEYLYICI